MADSSLVEPAIGSRGRLGSRARQIWSDLTIHPRGVWIMALCNFILWTGRGMIIPFIVIFFSQIVGLSATVVGAGIAASGIGGIVFVMFTAGQIDRRGGHPVLLACLVGIAIATFLYPLATGVVSFLIVTVILNFAGQLYWPSSDATIASLSDPDRVPEAMSVLRVANAIGIGFGGFVGGMIVSGGGMPEYRLLFITSALFVSTAGMLVWQAVPSVLLPSKSAAGDHGGWRDVLPDRTLLYALLILFILVFGFTQLTMSVPPFLRREAGISEGMIGLLFTLNTVIIVLTQIPIAARVNRGNLGRLLALGAGFWVIAFACMMGTTALGEMAAVCAFLAFTAGELLFMPATAVIPVRLAPAHLRGRYFAATSIVWGGSWAIAALVAGIALDLPQPAVLWPTVGGLMLIAGAGALRMQANPRLAPSKAT